MENTENIIERFEKVINDNRFTYDVELKFMQILINKYNPMSISDLARKRKLSTAAISKQLKNGKVQYLEFGSLKVIIGE